MDESEYYNFLLKKKYNEQKCSSRAIKEHKKGRDKVEERDPESFRLRMEKKPRKNSKAKARKERKKRKKLQS